MTFAEALDWGSKKLLEAGIDDAKNDAWLLLQYATKIDRSFYFMNTVTEMAPEQVQEFERVISKRTERVPLQYITGEQEFMGLKFLVNSSVLVPRQDTETLVEEALKAVSAGDSVLDMCTGSGCIAISMSRLSPGLKVTAVDISKQALVVAKENARINEVNIDFVRSNLFDNLNSANIHFDCIVSNPPYIRADVIPTLMPEVSEFEPIEALDGGVDGMIFYKDIVAFSTEFLNKGGRLLFEIGYDQGQQVSDLMKTAGFVDVTVVKDLSGNDRVVRGILP